MHQMRLCIEADPVGIEKSLLKNFSLSAGMLYALLMMKMVDPQEAFDILMQEEPPEVPASIPTVGTAVSTVPISVSQPNPSTFVPPRVMATVPPVSTLPRDPRQVSILYSVANS